VLISLSEEVSQQSLPALCADVGIDYQKLEGDDLEAKKLALFTIFSDKCELDILEDALSRTRSIKALAKDLPSPTAPKPIALFISYSHKDERWREEFDVDIRRMQEDGLIEAWYDGKILAGDEFDKEIREKLAAADIILLLVSRRFLGSTYIRNVEVPTALQRHQAGEAHVIPIILRPSSWEDLFGDMKVLPKDGKPIVTWKVKDEAFLEIYESVREIAAALGGSGG
jgi:TIR domain